jgi:hypothetical protein
MAYYRAGAILCLNNFKEAALYFNQVLPLNMGRMRGDPDVGDILIGYPEEIPSAALSHLVDGVEGNTITFSHATRIMELCMTKWSEFSTKVSPYAKLGPPNPSRGRMHDPAVEHQKLFKAYLANEQQEGEVPVRKAFADFARSLGVQSYAVAVPLDPQGTNADPCLTLSGLKLIDAESADWRQILEVRKDQASRRKLARMRLFLHSNYQDKSASFIEDDLLRRVDDYESTSKKFGFNTLTSSLGMLLDARSLQSSVGAGIVGALLGGAGVGVLTAAAVELGKIAINVAEKRHEMQSWQAGHELAYIFGTKEKLNQ